MAGERKFVDDNVKRVLLREYLKNQVNRAGYGGAEIQRTPMGTRVTLITERPGLVIGRKGSGIKAITNAIEFDFGFDKPQVEVVEVENANLSAQIMAEKLASALERGWHFRRAGHSTVKRIMDNGAKGCQVIISGKLTGQRHRTEKFKEGHIKFCGEPKLQWMEEGYTPAKLKAGVIGIKVQIMHPNARLPDEVIIHGGKTPEPKPEPKKDKAEDGEETKPAADEKPKKKDRKKAPKKDDKKQAAPAEPKPKEKTDVAEKPADDKPPAADTAAPSPKVDAPAETAPLPVAEPKAPPIPAAKPEVPPLPVTEPEAAPSEDAKEPASPEKSKPVVKEGTEDGTA